MARMVVVGLLCALGVAADVREQGPRDAAPSGLLAGVAKADITPPRGIIQQNWGSQTHLATTGNDPMGMRVQALALSDGRQKFVIAELDALSVAGLEGAIARAAERTGISRQHIRVSASHTHSGPSFQPNRGPVGADLEPYRGPFEEYRRLVADRLIQVIEEAGARMRPVHIHAGRGQGSINMNRRFRAEGGRPSAVGLNPGGFADRELLVVRIDDAEGRPYAALFNFPCHGTVLGYENQHASPDWIGAARRTVEEALPGATALFLQGAAGNLGPKEGFTGDLAVSHRLGSILGHEAAAIALSIDTVVREPRLEGFVESTAVQAKQPWRVAGPRDAALRQARRVFDVPARTYSAAEIEEMSRLVEEARVKAEAAKSGGDPWTKHQAEARHRRLADLLAKWRQVKDPEPVRVEVRVLRIGGIAVVSMPGEPFAEIGAAIKRDSPFEFTLFTAYADGEGGGYMPVAAEYGYGGYEVQMTPYGEGAADKLIQETAAMLRELR